MTTEVKRKRGRNTGAKGGAFEREMARKFTAWVSLSAPGIPDDLRGRERPEMFWRSATSGAKATMDRRRGVRSSKGGDFESTHPVTEMFIRVFSIELKFRNEPFMVASLIGKIGPFWNYWKQTERDARDTGKTPILVFKRNRGEIYIAYWSDYSPFARAVKKCVMLTVTSPSMLHGISICKLNDWMAVIHYGDWQVEHMLYSKYNKRRMEPLAAIQR